MKPFLSGCLGRHLCRHAPVRPPRLAGILATLLFVGFALSGANAQPAVPASFDFDTSPDTVVLSYTEKHALLPNDVPPLLRVYGDGRVHVHIPPYMKQAGDYEYHLAPGELRALMIFIGSMGVTEFDEGTAIADRNAAEVAIFEQTGELFHVSDETVTQIELNLANYRAPGLSGAIANFNKQVRWANLDIDVTRYPQLTDLKNLHAVVTRIRAILRDPELRLVK